MFTISSSLYDWSIVEKEIKPQTIHPTIAHHKASQEAENISKQSVNVSTMQKINH